MWTTSSSYVKIYIYIHHIHYSVKIVTYLHGVHSTQIQHAPFRQFILKWLQSCNLCTHPLNPIWSYIHGYFWRVNVKELPFNFRAKNNELNSPYASNQIKNRKISDLFLAFTLRNNKLNFFVLVTTEKKTPFLLLQNEIIIHKLMRHCDFSTIFVHLFKSVWIRALNIFKFRVYIHFFSYSAYCWAVLIVFFLFGATQKVKSSYRFQNIRFRIVDIQEGG